MVAFGAIRPSPAGARLVSMVTSLPSCLVHRGSTYCSWVKVPDGLAKSWDASVRRARTSTGLPVFLARSLAVSSGVGFGEVPFTAAVPAAGAVAVAAVAAWGASDAPSRATAVTVTAAVLLGLLRTVRFLIISPPGIRSPRTIDRLPPESEGLFESTGPTGTQRQVMDD